MTSIKEYIEAELALMQRVALDPVEQIVAQLARARSEGRRVFVFGNGGSASTASHLACDLGKGTIKPDLPRFKVIGLNDCVPVLTAYANDVGYDAVFAEPLISLAQRGDLAIGFSVSGNSPNIVRAMETADQLGIATIGFTGNDGGKLKDRVALHVNVPSSSFGPVEDIHLALAHSICEMLKIQHE